MTAAHLHLFLVHLPVVGAALTAALLLAALRRREAGLLAAALALLVVCAVFTVGAYYSGPPAHESLRAQFDTEANAWAQTHGDLARLALVLGILGAILAVQGLLQIHSGEWISRWLQWALVIVVFAFVYAGAWTAHLGGHIQHEELRSTEGVFFPALSPPEERESP